MTIRRLPPSTGPAHRIGSDRRLLVLIAGQLVHPAHLALVARQADQLVVVGQHKKIIADDPRAVAAGDLLFPDPVAGAQIDRRHAPAMADRENPAAIDDRAAADVGEPRHRIDVAGRGQIVRPQRPGRSRRAARTVRPNCRRAITISPSTAGLAPPSRPAVSGMPLCDHRRLPSSIARAISSLSTVTAKIRPSATVGGAWTGDVTLLRQITLPSAGSSASTSA